MTNLISTAVFLVALGVSAGLGLIFPLGSNDSVGTAPRTFFTSQGGTATATSPTAGDVLLSWANGSYGPTSLVAGTNVTISTSTYRQLSISASLTTSNEFTYGTNIFSQTSLAPTTTTANLEIEGTGTSTFAGGLEAWRQVASPYFHATSSTATSTFTGGVNALALSLTNLLAVSQGGTGAATITGLVLGNGAAAMTAYTGIDCTNQFVRDVSAAGAGTCATITSADVDLADLTATDSTLTFSGAYDGQTARTIGINLANANTWTALQTITNASTTHITAATELVVPRDKTLGFAGEVTTDDTSGQFRWYANSAQRVLPGDRAFAFAYASTTQGSGTSTLRLGVAPWAITAVSVRCDFSNFMGISLFDGTNRADYFVASSTIGTVTYTTNNTFTNGEALRVDVGTSTNIAADVRGGCTVQYTSTAD